MVVLKQTFQLFKALKNESCGYLFIITKQLLFIISLNKVFIKTSFKPEEMQRIPKRVTENYCFRNKIYSIK